MRTIDLKKGYSQLAVKIPDDKILDIVVGKDVKAIDHNTIKQIISKGIKNNAPDDITLKKTVIIIPDDTRLWARGDLFVPQIVETIMAMGVPKRNIQVIIALGTHEDMQKKQFTALAGDFCFKNIEILNSANKNKGRLVYIGETGNGTIVNITKEAVEADHIIIFGGILHHMAAGFGGGRKYILPGIAGYESVQQNHSLAMKKDGSAHPLVRQGRLKGNPIHEDMVEAADLFLKGKSCTYVAVAANGMGDIFYAQAGPLENTFLNGCKALDSACCIQVPKKADFVVFSAGGHRTDGQLYQSTKALFNAVNTVKEGGDIIFIAECARGVGNRSFASAIEKFKTDPKPLGIKLTKEFNMPAYVAFRVIDLLIRFNITLVSDLTRQQTSCLGFNFSDNLDETINRLKGKGYIIPFAENILPVVKDSH